jgi:predicted kinase
MEGILFIGLQASGKSSFYLDKFYTTHLRLNLDMLSTRRKEIILFKACLESRQKVVIDNTNPTIQDRLRYIGSFKKNYFKVIGYYFQSQLEVCLERNNKREGKQRVKKQGMLSTYNRLVIPSFQEGFDELFYVQLIQDKFCVEKWCNDN